MEPTLLPPPRPDPLQHLRRSRRIAASASGARRSPASCARRACSNPGAMGSLGRITSLADLPPDKALIAYLRQGAAYIESGQGANRLPIDRRVAKVPKAAPETPPEFATALAKNKGRRQSLRRLQPKLPARIHRMDRRRQTPRNPRPPHHPGRRVDRRRQTAQLEVSGLLAASRDRSHGGVDTSAQRFPYLEQRRIGP